MYMYLIFIAFCSLSLSSLRFIKSRPHMEEFLTLLLEFQHFQQFLNGRIERLKCNRERDIFDDEVIVYEEELKSGKWSSDQMKVAFKDMKVIGITVYIYTHNSY